MIRRMQAATRAEQPAIVCHQPRPDPLFVTVVVSPPKKSTRAPRCRVPLPQPLVASCIVHELLPLRTPHRPECLPECIRTLLCRPPRYTPAIHLHSPSRTCSLECKTRTGAMMKRCVLYAGVDPPRCSCRLSTTRRTQNAPSVWRKWTSRILTSSRVRAATRCDYMHTCPHGMANSRRRPHADLPFLLASYQGESQSAVPCLPERVHRRGCPVQAHQQGGVSGLVSS